MPKTQFTVHTSLAPSDVLALLTDFGPDRAQHWPNIDEAHYQVHDQGPGWAEVTEGTAMGWERERYTWDADAAPSRSTPSTPTCGDRAAVGATR
jgi:hypothetical protein